MPSFRSVCAKLHRYAGLTTAVFLTIAGLTGSVIAFDHEVDELLNPELHRTTSGPMMLTPGQIAERFERAEPRARVTGLPLEVKPGESLSLGITPRLDSKTGKPFDLGYDEAFIDPATGTVLGTRTWGECCFARKNIVPFLYSVHYSLHIPGVAGTLIMGIVAMIWALDCFVAFYLTLPRAKPFFARWKTAWTIKPNAGAYRRNLDLHRAGGLWLWGVLLMLATSAVSFNLYDQVFRPIVSVFATLTPTVWDARKPADEATGSVQPTVPFPNAVTLADAEAKRLGWTDTSTYVFYSTEYGLYGVIYGDPHTSGLGARYVYVDGTQPRILSNHVPGTGTAGDTFMEAQFPMHSGRILGLPGRILICLTGLVVAMLSITGVIIWFKKTRSRRRVDAEDGRSLAMADGIESLAT